MNQDQRTNTKGAAMSDERIIEYKTIIEHAPSALDQKVNEYLGKGWKPWQGPVMNTPVRDGDEVIPVYLQAVVKVG